MPDEKSNGLRLPKSAYKDSNGFIDPSRLQVTGQVLTAISRTDSPNVQQREIRDQVEKRRFASHILESRGEYCPDLQTMKAAINTPETAASVKTRLLEEQKRHREEIADLYDWQVNEYLLGAEQNYYSKDDSVDAADVNSFYKSLRKPRIPSIFSSTSQLEAERYAHLVTFLPLAKQKEELTRSEETERRRQEAKFPQSISEYRAIRNPDVHLRICKFLLADTVTKEHMLSDHGWAWRQVKPLEDEFRDNEDFSSEIKERLRALETTDPRRKPSLVSS